MKYYRFADYNYSGYLKDFVYYVIIVHLYANFVLCSSVQYDSLRFRLCIRKRKFPSKATKPTGLLPFRYTSDKHQLTVQDNGTGLVNNCTMLLIALTNEGMARLSQPGRRIAAQVDLAVYIWLPIQIPYGPGVD